MRDRHGLALSTTSSVAAEQYAQGVDRLLAGWPQADTFFRQAIEADPAFALARIALGRFFQVYGRVAEAREQCAAARRLVAGATARERGHVEAIGLLIDGAPGPAFEAVVRHTTEFPRDALVLSLALGAFGLFAFSGRADHDAARLAMLRRMSGDYGDDWWFLTHLGWSHTEAGELEAGRRITARALELRRENAHGAHAMAHSFHECGESRAGRAFIEGWLPGYDRAGAMHCHLAWHIALFSLEEGEPQRAFALYGDCIRPAVATAPPINVLTDGVALLFRLAPLRQELPWREQIEYAKEKYPMAGNAFIDTHYALAAAGAGDTQALDQRICEVDRLHAEGKLPAGAVVPALCRAIKACADKNYEEVVQLLEPLQQDFVRLGGSNAQREMYAELLARARRAL